MPRRRGAPGIRSRDENFRRIHVDRPDQTSAAGREGRQGVDGRERRVVATSAVPGVDQTRGTRVSPVARDVPQALRGCHAVFRRGRLSPRGDRGRGPAYDLRGGERQSQARDPDPPRGAVRQTSAGEQGGAGAARDADAKAGGDSDVDGSGGEKKDKSGDAPRASKVPHRRAAVAHGGDDRGGNGGEVGEDVGRAAEGLLRGDFYPRDGRL